MYKNPIRTGVCADISWERTWRWQISVWKVSDRKMQIRAQQGASAQSWVANIKIVLPALHWSGGVRGLPHGLLVGGETSETTPELGVSVFTKLIMYLTMWPNDHFIGCLFKK